MDLHHIAFRTRQLPALTDFYQKVLAWPLVREQPGYSVWFGVGSAVVMIEVAAAEEPALNVHSKELVAFRVSQRERQAIVARLTEYGASVEAETDYTTYFRDPDGRRIGVSTYSLESALKSPVMP